MIMISSIKKFLNKYFFGAQKSKSPKDKRKTCKVTGIDISMQKKNSFLLSHTGLKYYLKHDRQLYNEIKSQYLSEHWEEASVKTQIREIAHSIRGHYTNMKKHHEKLNPPDQYSLFE